MTDVGVNVPASAAAPSASSAAAASAVPPTSSNAVPSSSSSASAAAAAASTASAPQPSRPSNDRIIIKLTVNLMHTYNDINEKYYANKRKRIMEQQAQLAKAKQQQAAAAAANSSSSSSSSGSSGSIERPLLYNDGHDDKDYNYIVQPHELFANRYVVDHSIGKGSFGRVVKAFDTLTRRYVAVKIVKSKSAFYKQAQIELKILLSLQADADRWNIVHVIDQFMHRNHQCIVFELLSLNLYELLRNTRFTGVSLKLIAKFGQQLLCTLGYLNSKERGEKRVIHCDLKPENILLRNCFPARDHEILTEEGFMDLEGVRRRLQSKVKTDEAQRRQVPGKRRRRRRRIHCWQQNDDAVTQHAAISSQRSSPSLRIACFNPSTNCLEYHPITLDDLTVQHGVHEMVHVRDTNDKDPSHASPTTDIDVSMTRGHDVYVRRGHQTNADRSVRWCSSRYQKLPAHTLLPPSSATLSSQQRFSFLSNAAGGVLHSSSAHSSLMPLPLDLSFLTTLDLHTQSEVESFLELYGWWMAQTHANDDVFRIGTSSVDVHAHSNRQLTRLQHLLPHVHLQQGHDFDIHSSHTTSDSRYVSIRNQRWLDCFYSHLSTNDDILPRWIVQRLDKQLLRSFIRGLAQPSTVDDIHEQQANTSHGQIHVSSTRFRDELMVALLHAGFTAVFTAIDSNSPSTPSTHRISSSTKPSPPQWRIDFTDSGEMILNPSQHVTSSKMEGSVWCVTVPQKDQLIVVRRVEKDDEGQVTKASRPIIIGNCKKSAIKVIDFGSACFAHQKTYTYIQSRFYRAPEVLLGLPYNSAIDMWSLGCILMEMHTGRPLFDGQDESDQMLKQVEILGMPPRHMLDDNKKALKFFEQDSKGEWRLRSKFHPERGLNLRMMFGYKWQDTLLYREFEHLISQMLVYDPLKRIRPSQALQHPFFALVVSMVVGGTEGPQPACASVMPPDQAAAASSSMTHGTGSGVATTMTHAAAAAAAADVNMATSPKSNAAAASGGTGSAAMDISSPRSAQMPAAAPDAGSGQQMSDEPDQHSSALLAAATQQQQQQRMALLQQQQQQIQMLQQAHYQHRHAVHHGYNPRSSRKRPHSNPLLGSSSIGTNVGQHYMHQHHHHHHQQPVQPLDPRVQQAILAQSQKYNKQQQQQQADEQLLQQHQHQSAAASSSQMDESAPDSTSTVISSGNAPTNNTTSTNQTPTRAHGMLTRGKAAAEAAAAATKRDPLADMSQLNVKDSTSTTPASGSGRSSPATTKQARSRGNSRTNVSDAAVSHDLSSSPNASAADHAAVVPATSNMSDVPSVGDVQRNGGMIVSRESSKNDGSNHHATPPRQSSASKKSGGGGGSSGKRGKGRGKGNKQRNELNAANNAVAPTNAAMSTSPPAAADEYDGGSSSARQLSRMSLDLDNNGSEALDREQHSAARVSHRTRAQLHAANHA